MAASSESESDSALGTQVTSSGRPGLKKIPPYWYPYRTNAKARWFDREILEVVSTEFRDRSVEYYRYALQSGVTTINGKIARPGTIVRNGDTLENIVHRHEPPVTSTPVEILHRDVERNFIVINKPGSIPVHAAGRYFKNSLVEILKDDFGFKSVYTVNRLDRLTSGLMIIALTADRARTLTAEFTSGTIHKEYVARVRGEFPAEEITCEEPLLTVDRQMGLNIVHPEGKDAKTVFKRMHYDRITDTSVVHCRPFTGRSHQIRVHLQFLGHPIANDSVYADSMIWGPRVGRGGIDNIPSEEREAPQPPPGFEDSTAEGRGRSEPNESFSTNSFKSRATEAGARPSHNGELPELPSTLPTPRDTVSSLKKKNDKRMNPAWRTKEESAALTANHTGEEPKPGLLPRETGHDIGLGAPVPLSSEAVCIITRLRNQKDKDEDWSRWRDVVFRARGALAPRVVELAYAQQHAIPRKAGKKKMGKKAKDTDESGIKEAQVKEEHVSAEHTLETPVTSSLTSLTSLPLVQDSSDDSPQPSSPTAPSTPLPLPALTSVPARIQAQSYDPISDVDVSPPTKRPDTDDSKPASDALYCPECYLPLHPDPLPEKLYIFLHALRYTSASLGAFETRLPEWAAEGYVWERDTGTEGSVEDNSNIRPFAN